MLSKEELLEYPNYLLTNYQLEIYKQLIEYKEANKLSQKELAEKLKVSNSYVSQILNGNFNYTLKKLIELGLMIGKVPYLKFISPDEYWLRESWELNASPKSSYTVNIFTSNLFVKPDYSNPELNKTEKSQGIYMQTIEAVETLSN